MIFPSLVMFACGIFFSGYLDSDIPVFMLVSVSLSVIFCLFGKNKKFLKILSEFILFITCFFLGHFYFYLNCDNLYNKSQKYIDSCDNVICGTVTDNITDKLKGCKFILKTKDGVKISVDYSGIIGISPGDKVKLKTNFLSTINRDNDFVGLNCTLKGEGTVILLKCSELDLTGIDKKYSLQRYFYNVRKSTFLSLLRYLSYDEAAFTYSVISSDKSYISNEIYEQLTNAGLLHLCTVSGFHFTFLCLCIWFLILLVTKNYRKRLIITFVFSFLFILYTGFSVSVIRAFLMFLSTGVCDIFFIKRVNNKKIFVILIFLFMLFNPLIIYNSSFLLSFSAIGGIIFFSGYLNAFLSKMHFKLKSYTVMILGVNLATVIISYSLFGRVTLWSFATNLFAEYDIGVIMILSLLICIFSKIFPPAAYIIAPWLKLSTGLLFFMIEKVSYAPEIRFIFPVSMAVAMFAVISIFCIFQCVENIKKPICLFGVVISIFLTVFFYKAQFYDNNVYIDFIGDESEVCADIIYKHEHYVIGSIKALYYNSYSSSLKMNEKIKLLVLNDEDNNDKKLLDEIKKKYMIENIIAAKKAGGTYKSEYYKDKIIKIKHNKIKHIDEIYVYNNRIIMTNSMRYIAFDAEKEQNCSIIFSDFNNAHYKELINSLDFQKSTFPIVMGDGYEKNCRKINNYSLIKIIKNGRILIDGR